MVCNVLLWYDRIQRNHFSKDLLSFLVGLLWSSSTTMNLPLKLLSILRVLCCHTHWEMGSRPRVQGCLMENGSPGYSQREDWILVNKTLWDQAELTHGRITARSSTVGLAEKGLGSSAENMVNACPMWTTVSWWTNSASTSRKQKVAYSEEVGGHLRSALVSEK